MSEELAGANVNRAYSLAATNTAVFSFMLFFLYPRFENGRINPIMFQIMLVVMGISTFALVFATLCYYRASVDGRMTEAERMLHTRKADRLWLVGYTIMFLTPGLVLLLIKLVAVAMVWLALWLAYLLFVIRSFPKMQTPRGPGA